MIILLVCGVPSTAGLERYSIMVGALLAMCNKSWPIKVIKWNNCIKKMRWNWQDWSSVDQTFLSLIIF